MKLAASCSSSYLLWSLLAAAAAVIVGTVGTVSASGGSCACEAEELGFTIDCADTQTMLDALTFLKTNACSVDCSSEECEKNYYIVQAHHDFCPEDEVPEAIEDGFHDFDEFCVNCSITKPFVEGAPDCPAPACEDDSGNDAYTALVETGCNLNCDSDVCRDLYFVLRTVHDECDHGVLSVAAEKGLHDLERPCQDHVCNKIDPGSSTTGNSLSSQLVCDDDDHDEEEEEEEHHHDHDHGHDHDSHDGEDSASSSSLAAISVSLAAAITTALVVVVVIII